MKFKFLLIHLLLSSVIICNAQYAWQALPGAPTSYRFDDFHFISPDTGWAINPSYSSRSVPQFGRVFRTYDGGHTWEKLIDSSITFYRSVGFVDAHTGWIGNLGQYTTDTVPLYQTNDGGNSWSPVALPQPRPPGICGISVVTDSVVYAYGRYSGPAGYVKTIDKGATWVFADLDSMAFGLIDGHFFNKDTGFITGMGTDRKAIILATTDGGASWGFAYHSTHMDSDRVWKIHFSSRNTGYASVQYGGKRSPYNNWFLKTTDGGKTWIEKRFWADYNEEGIGFINDSVGWIGGDSYRGTYKTTDGGDTWYNDESFGLYTPPYSNANNDFSINRFRSFGDTIMYASGNTLYKLKPVFTGIEDLDMNSKRLSNYPNPFKEQTTFVYELPLSSNNVTLQINNLFGQKVYLQQLGPQKKGVNQFLLSGCLPDGIYYYTVCSDQFRMTAKMTIAK